MDIKKYFNLKTLLALSAVIGLTFNNVFAQVAGAADEVSKTDGLGKMVSYYLLLFLLACWAFCLRSSCALFQVVSSIIGVTGIPIHSSRGRNIFPLFLCLR